MIAGNSGADRAKSSSNVIVRLLAAARETRPIAESAHPTGHDDERLDATAGCEFVDDRIREME